MKMKMKSVPQTVSLVSYIHLVGWLVNVHVPFFLFLVWFFVFPLVLFLTRVAQICKKLDKSAGLNSVIESSETDLKWSGRLGHHDEGVDSEMARCKE